MRRMIYWIIGVLVGLFLLMQLIPVAKTNPPVTREVKWDSPQTRDLAQRACFDCHSNETVYPWYSNVAPVKFILANHINEGRGRLNFSQWDGPNSDFEEVQKVIERGEMPLKDYLLMHPEAKLTDVEKGQLLSGLSSTFQQDPPIEGPRRGERD